MENIDPTTLQGLHVFYNPFSNCAGRVLLAIAEKNLDAQEHFIDLMKSEQLSDAYIRINPKGEVPAIVHNGHPMHESCDILRYLEQTFPEIKLSPESQSLKLEMDAWLNSAAASHETGIVNYVYSHGFGRLPTPRDWIFYQEHIPHRTQFHNERRRGLTASDPRQAEEELRRQFSKLEQALENKHWLVGDDYSLADIAWFPNTIILRMLGFSFRPFPNVRQWIARIERRPAYSKALGEKLPKVPLWLIKPIVKTTLRIKRKLGKRF